MLTFAEYAFDDPSENVLLLKSSLFIRSCRVLKVSPLWVLQDLLVLRANQDPQGLDDLGLEGRLALLDPLDLHLHMDPVCA